MTQYHPKNKPNNEMSKRDSKRSNQSNIKRKQKSKKGLIIALIVVGVLVVLGALFAIKARSEISIVKEEAYLLKEDLWVCADSLKNMDPTGAEEALTTVNERNQKIQERLNTPFWKIVEVVPYFGKDVTTVKELMGLLDSMSDSVLSPLIGLVREYPLSDLKVNESDINVNLLNAYLDFLDTAEPSITEAVETLSTVKFRVLKMDLSSYQERLGAITSSIGSLDNYIDLLRNFLGHGEDREYLIMAQNSAEIRASGGFPGSMGLIRIHDGLLTIGDFSSVTNYLYSPTVSESDISDRETELFQYMYANWAHDACYNPHFAKVAHITKVAYDIRNDASLDGVISLTPAIIQQILSITGNEIDLFDGTILNGENATRIIERELYYRYQGTEGTAVANNEIIDELFAETAAKAMGAMFSNLNIDVLLQYFEMFREGSANRTIMMWFANESDEATCITAGCSGNLTSDPVNPVAGVYFSCCDPGRLGMFIEINTEVSEPTVLDDGRKQYTVTATFNNYINEEDIWGINSSYILGSNGGAIQSYIYFFAPAGGSVSDFSTSNGDSIAKSDYEGLELGYILNELLFADNPFTVTYTVTTAPEAESELRIETTPTLQEYK